MRARPHRRTRACVHDPSARELSRRPTTRLRRTAPPIRIASPTFSGPSPPARTMRRVRARIAAACQSARCPVPPLASGATASTSSRTSSGQLRAALTSPSASRPRALTTRRPIRRAVSTGSSPCSWMTSSPTSVPIASISSTAASTNTPTRCTNGGNVRAIAFAASGSTTRGLPGQNTNPTACAPRSAACHASSRRVMPQNLIAVMRAPPTPAPPTRAAPTAQRRDRARS